MSLRKIITYPHPVLRKKAEPVTVFDKELEQLVVDMAETMYDAPGSGLAANQIGELRQVIIVDVREADEAKNLHVFINPLIVAEEGSVTDVEGCLSVLEYSSNVKRAQKVRVRALDVKGKQFEFEAEEWFARALQHEIDHLHGKLFIDHISSLKRTLYKKKLKKMLKEQEETA